MSQVFPSGELLWLEATETALCISFDNHSPPPSLRWVCHDFPELKLAVENYVLNDFDPTRFVYMYH